ncbi:MAG: hypothetical protein GW763_03785 [Paraglaciecola sp.]|nr:hypothetical protein [Paraglaciecola sp.]NCT47108.1 hypothetical protein [Paraglaciecola sp.]
MRYYFLLLFTHFLSGCSSPKIPDCLDVEVQKKALNNHLYEMTDLNLRALKKQRITESRAQFDYAKYIKEAEQMREKIIEDMEYRMVNTAPIKIEENIQKIFCEANVERSKKGKDKWKSIGPVKISFTAQILQGDLKIENTTQGISELRSHVSDIKPVIDANLQLIEY